MSRSVGIDVEYDTFNMSIDQNNNQMIMGDEQVTACDDGSFCCGTGPQASNCCIQREGTRIDSRTFTSRPPLRTITRSISSTLSIFTPTATTQFQSIQSSPTASPPPPASPSPFAPSHPSKFPPVYAAVIGISIALVLLFIAIIYLAHRRRNPRPRHQHHHKPCRKPPQEDSVNDSIVILDVDGSTPSTMNTRRLMPGIGGRVRPPELRTPECAVRVDMLERAVIQMGF